MGVKQTVKAAADAVREKASSILGTFTGKCLDTNVFNNNDWRASRPVFEKLMASDEYKMAMENRHYVGFLGHPEDTDCQDDQNACIVMTDMKLLDNGEVEGSFDLIDTPVGRIVKAFIDAGVKYGISIRGLGDIDAAGEVDPDEFIFRGFDLVRFPAYDDCIPTFTAIAASTDVKKKAQYKKICASIDANLQYIKSSEALELIQEQLPEDSDEYNKVQERLDEIASEAADKAIEAVAEETSTDGNDSASVEITVGTLEEIAEDDVNEATEENLEIAAEVAGEKLAAMTELYLDAAEAVRNLEQDLAEAQAENQELILECSTLKSQNARVSKLVANQVNDASERQIDLEAKCQEYHDKIQQLRASLVSTRSELRKTKIQIAASEDTHRKELQEQLKANNDLKKSLSNMEASYDRQVTANTRLKAKISELRQKGEEDDEAIRASDNLNLKYKQKIKANSEAISQKDSAIEELKAQLDETVVKCEELESKASNLDEKNGELISRVEAAEEMVSSYQQAYANMYANALGVYLKDLPVTASTSVEELTSMIKAGTSTAGIPSSSSYYLDDGEEYIDADEEILDDDVNYSAGMVTL